MAFGERDTTERLFSTLKERTRRSYNDLPSDRPADLAPFLSASVLWYNRLRRREALEGTPWGASS
ncbi:MAG: hypothetical protein JRN59_08090 [Nitrososphaerota archaeon]|jgi:hypothetical protein|nr:hypothetical protein [Nitrososphaerota archaeon]